MRNLLYSSTLVIATAVFAVPAQALVILDPHPTAFTPAGQIHNSGNQSGDGEVFAHTQPGDFDFTLTSLSNLSTNGNGHAQFDGPFHSATFQGTLPTTLFNAIDFNLNVPNGNFFTDILVTYADGVTTELFDNIGVGNGENKFLIYGDAGEVFKSISWTLWADQGNITAANFLDVRQIDVDVVTGSIDVPTPVPEPVTWAMMLLGFGFIGAAMRKSRRTTRVSYSFA